MEESAHSEVAKSEQIKTRSKPVRLLGVASVKYLTIGEDEVCQKFFWLFNMLGLGDTPFDRP